MHPGRKRFFLASAGNLFQAFASMIFAGRRLPDVGLILSLVRRDYAVQFAGTALGIVWVLVQYIFQIGIFFLIFGVILPQAPGAAEAGGGKLAAFTAGRADYLSFLLGGMCLWLPLSEMLLRSCSILADNRGLIRRTGLGLRGFLWVPVFEGLIHYALIFGIVAAVGFARGVLSPLFPLAFLGGSLVLLLFSGWAFIFARISILLKDVSPLMRLIFQIAFWLTPIVYVVSLDWMRYFAWNPLTGILETHRRLLFSGTPGDFAAFADFGNNTGAVESVAALFVTIPGAPVFGIFSGVACLVALSVPAYLLSARRLNGLVVDQL
ncbi:MAG: ABC transporter permease [Leptospirales bacterium]|jgi:lipopolysaccharide transport system permease protein